jgi:hypothetical protein
MQIGRKFQIRRTNSENSRNADICHPHGPTLGAGHSDPSSAADTQEAKVLLVKLCDVVDGQHAAIRANAALRMGMIRGLSSMQMDFDLSDIKSRDK